MFSKVLKATVLGIIFVGIAGLGFAATINKTLTVQASITSHQAMSVTVTPIEPYDDPNTPNVDEPDIWHTEMSTDESTPIAFNLSFNDTYKIWMAQYYYAIDVGLDTNDPNWTLSISGTSFRDPVSGETLDYNVNAGLFSVLPDPNGDGNHDDDVQNDIAPLISYADLISYGTINASDVPSGQFLRIYLGVATGNGDAPGVSPIGLDKPAGNYSGTIQLSFTAN